MITYRSRRSSSCRHWHISRRLLRHESPNTQKNVLARSAFELRANAPEQLSSHALLPSLIELSHK